jgi:hypothetical protein
MNLYRDYRKFVIAIRDAEADLRTRARHLSNVLHAQALAAANLRLSLTFHLPSMGVLDLLSLLSVRLGTIEKIWLVTDMHQGLLAVLRSCCSLTPCHMQFNALTTRVIVST